jgi:hypothetical protein
MRYKEMIYNLKEDKEQNITQCVKCKYLGKDKICRGLRKCCFEYNPITKNSIDQTTKLPLTESAIKTIKSKLESEE